MTVAPDPVEIFRALSDQTRLRCLALMVSEGEVCVCELTYAINEIQPKISRHLAALRRAGMVEDRRHGPWVFYRLNPAMADWARTVLDVTCQGVSAASPFREDQQTLRAMPGRPPRRA